MVWGRSIYDSIWLISERKKRSSPQKFRVFNGSHDANKPAQEIKSQCLLFYLCIFYTWGYLIYSFIGPFSLGRCDS